MIRLQMQYLQGIVLVPEIAIFFPEDVHRDGQQTQEPSNSSHHTCHLDSTLSQVPVNHVVGEAIEEEVLENPVQNPLVYAKRLSE